MAQIKEAFYVPMGALSAKIDGVYTTNNISIASDTVVLVRGVRILDENGAETPIRGSRVLITNNEIPAVAPVPNVPFIWVEGFEMGIEADYTYRFLDACIVAYGKKVVI